MSFIDIGEQRYIESIEERRIQARKKLHLKNLAESVHFKLVLVSLDY